MATDAGWSLVTWQTSESNDHLFHWSKQAKPPKSVVYIADILKAMLEKSFRKKFNTLAARRKSYAQVNYNYRCCVN